MFDMEVENTLTLKPSEPIEELEIDWNYQQNNRSTLKTSTTRVFEMYSLAHTTILSVNTSKHYTTKHPSFKNWK
jgi:hypothetical protein